MKFTTVCYLFETPPLKTYYERYDMQLLKDKGYQVKVYDVSPILHPVAYEKVKNDLLEEVTDIEVNHITSKNEFKRLIKADKNTFYWSTVSFYSKSYWMFKNIQMSYYGFVCNVDYVPTVGETQSRRDIQGFIKNFSWKRLKEAVFVRIPRKLLIRKKADVVITYTPDYLQNVLRNVIWDDDTKIEFTNTLDYNQCKKVIEKEERIVNEKYCVFIDQYFPLHPDGKELGVVVDPDKYYEEVTYFLEKVRDILGVKVVIAAHPRSNYELYPQYFSDLDIYKFKTCELIQYADIVLSHASISLSYVAILKKPLLLLSTDDMEKADIWVQALKAAGRATQHSVINVSKCNTEEEIRRLLDEEFQRDSSYYEKQKLHYCLDEKKYPNANLAFGEILIKAMTEVSGRS